MYSLQASVLLVTLLTYASFINASPLQKRSSFKIRTTRNVRNTHPHAGAAAMLKAYRKFGFETSSLAAHNMTATDVAAAAETGTVSAVPEANAAAFLENVKIGGQALNLDFDTGSSDFWVFNTQLDSASIGQHKVFDPQKSKTFKPIKGATFQISYGDGSAAAGNAGTDTVNVGGATVTQQVVQLATAVSGSFIQDSKNDGLVGLAFSQLNTLQPQQAKTFFDNVMDSLAKPVFSVDLRADGTGTYEFGSINTTEVKGGKLATVPVDATSGFWQFASTSFAVNGQVQQNSLAAPAIADTGTSLMVVDDFVAESYYSQVPGAQFSTQVGGFVYPCDAALPDLSVAVGDHMATVPGSVVTFAQVDGQTCFGGIQGNGGSSKQIFGDTFFKSQYVVFDGKQQALQLGNKAQL